tara:strand:+ start:13176 stop:13472 length:297 start_codon:yes stop_codon:yes gene_type:complete
MQQSIIKQATQHFRKGDFQRAKASYQQAAELYGTRLFANSIRLCELRMGQQIAPEKGPATPALGNGNDVSRQLEETQNLLEHYYTRCQELEYQLMDRT